ncbi:MAG: S1 RNA-binding domain-containing protein, partial [Clostridiales bacterium]|nr:S1 RNA-binding domain-containing protein [Clostridiales bacterium]
GWHADLGAAKDGLVQLSKLADHRIGRVEDAVNVGDMIWVKVTEIDEKGRINLSHIDAIREIKTKKLGR